MCMFSRPVREVSKTRLTSFVVQDETKTPYCICSYANQVESQDSSKSNTMILPVPCPDAKGLYVYEEKSLWMEELVEEMSKKYHSLIPQSTGSGAMMGFSLSNAAPLEVKTAGSYSYSIAPTLQDVKRADASIFEMASGLEETLGQHYATGYCFLLLVLTNTKKEAFHPFLYGYPEPTMSVCELPTRHYHGGSPGKATMIDDWDHDVYWILPKSNSPGTSSGVELNGSAPRCLSNQTLADQTVLYSWIAKACFNLNDSAKSTKRFSPLKDGVLIGRKVRIRGSAYNGDLKYVYDSSKASSSSSSSPSAYINLHRCDNCNKSVVPGDWLRCSVCKDIDFCSACYAESKNLNFIVDGHLGTDHLMYVVDTAKKELAILSRVATQKRGREPDVDSPRQVYAFSPPPAPPARFRFPPVFHPHTIHKAYIPGGMSAGEFRFEPVDNHLHPRTGLRPTGAPSEYYYMDDNGNKIPMNPVMSQYLSNLH